MGNYFVSCFFSRGFFNSSPSLFFPLNHMFSLPAGSSRTASGRKRWRPRCAAARGPPPGPDGQTVRMHAHAAEWVDTASLPHAAQCFPMFPNFATGPNMAHHSIAYFRASTESLLTSSTTAPVFFFLLSILILLF